MCWSIGVWPLLCSRKNSKTCTSRDSIKLVTLLTIICLCVWRFFLQKEFCSLKSLHGLSKLYKTLQLSFHCSACAIKPWWHWQVQFCSSRSASRNQVCIRCRVLNEVDQCVLSWIHISLVSCQVKLDRGTIIRDKIVDTMFSSLILPNSFCSWLLLCMRVGRRMPM